MIQESPIPGIGNLTHWAEHGVFLLNASLTVRAGEPMSHAKIGWAEFTDTVIKKISELKSHVVFLLWGKFAQEKRGIDKRKQTPYIESSTPLAPFGACRFFRMQTFFKGQCVFDE